jgi:hypothetical protein
MKRAIRILFGMLWIAAFLFAPVGNCEEFKKHSLAHDRLNVSQAYQPNFENPKKYTSEDMRFLAREVLAKTKQILKVEFDRGNLDHVRYLAEFFGLTSDDKLDRYSTAMSDSDISYFMDMKQFGKKELYPQNNEQLVIRFYWEGLARLAAVHDKLKVVDNKFVAKPRMSRGKVSDMATTAMFDKRPGISIKQAVAEGKERYDFGELIKHLHAKGLAAQE